MSKDIHITIKNADDFAFTLMLVGLVLIFFISTAITKKPNYGPDMWDDNQPLEHSTGIDY